MSQPVRTRFAPSPTGFLHVGGVRTALFAWLVARQAGGQFILRIEDTDRTRHVEDTDQHIVQCLSWLGLHYDEGPIYQSQRVKDGVYKKWAQKLIDVGRAYPDPYTSEEVHHFREEAKKAGKPFRYIDHRPLNRDKLWNEKVPLRFMASDGANYRSENATKDAVMGTLETGPEAVDDFILIKSDGYPTYNFAHIVDDIEMGITHVIRGQEFLASLPNYRNLYEALGEQLPIFATVPHILNAQGNKKLSKRDGAKDILDYHHQGYLPEAMVNFLATLGWNDGTKQEIFSVKELVKKFDLSRVQKGGAHFDERRLQWLNGAHIRQLPLDSLYEKVMDFWPQEATKYPDSYRKQVLALVQERLKYFSELLTLTNFFFEDLAIDPELISTHKQLKKLSTQEVKSLLEQARASLEQSNFSIEDLTLHLNGLLIKTNQKPVVLFSLIRIATTQATASPELAATLQVLTKPVVLRRLDSQLATL